MTVTLDIVVGNGQAKHVLLCVIVYNAAALLKFLLINKLFGKWTEDSRMPMS